MGTSDAFRPGTMVVILFGALCLTGLAEEGDVYIRKSVRTKERREKPSPPVIADAFELE